MALGAIPGISTGGGSLDLSSRATSGPAASGAHVINVGTPPARASINIANPATWIMIAVGALAAYAFVKWVK